MKTFVRKILWRIGVVFLRMAGLKIPEDSFKYFFVSVPLDGTFVFPAGGDIELRNRLMRETELDILRRARPYVHIEHTKGEEDIVVRMKLIVQRYERQ